MALTKLHSETQVDAASISHWPKIAITFFTSSAAAIFVLSILSTQKALLGLSTELLTVASLALTLFLILITVAFWFFPDSTLPLFIYWLICLLREQICMLALLGMAYLLTIHAAFFSLRGGIPLLNLIVLFLLGLFVPQAGLDQAPLAWMKQLTIRLRKWVDKINLIPTPILSVAVGLLPILTICLVIYVGLNASLSDYRPFSFWNDETAYWLWIRSFSHVGFNVGYNSPNELIAPAAFNHYGEGSPFYIYIYGAIGRLVGWSPQLPILINFVILALAIILFIRSTKLNSIQIIFTGLITLVTWPILLYLPMTTHETLNQVIGFILAIVFFKLLIAQEQLSLPVRILFVVLVYLAALIRLSWGLLLIPVIFYSLNGSVFRRVLLAVLLGSGLYVSAVLITSYLVPPTNNSIFLNIKDSLVQGPQVFIKYIAWQLSRMFRFKQLNPNIAIMLQIVIIIGWNAIRLVHSIKSKLSTVSILQSRTVFDIYNMASLTMAGLLFYLQVGFYRTFTPSILIVYLLQTVKKDYRFLITLLTINVLFFHSYMTFYAHIGDAQIIKADFTTEFSGGAQVQADVEKWIVFDSATKNPWCNTLLIPQHYYDYRLVAVPAGIGISWIQERIVMKTPLHSKYLLFDQDTYQSLADHLNVQLLESLSIGDLYYNLDSGCKLNH